MLAERVGEHHGKQQPQEDVWQDSTGCCRYSPGFLALSRPATGALDPEVCVGLEPFSESQLLLGRAMALIAHSSEGGCHPPGLCPSIQLPVRVLPGAEGSLRTFPYPFPQQQPCPWSHLFQFQSSLSQGMLTHPRT